MTLILQLLCLAAGTFAWPDGAPCLRKIVESMYPEADEHSGGLRSGAAPYRLFAYAECYREGVPIQRITLPQPPRLQSMRVVWLQLSWSRWRMCSSRASLCSLGT